MDKCCFIRCSDSYDNLTGDRLPRGKAGVAIAWPKQWASKASSMNCGNERVIAVEIEANIKILVVTVYMPTNYSTAESCNEYCECLDILHDILTKFNSTHRVIIAGDFNGTLLQPRAYNKHDKLLTNFVSEHGLHHYMNTDEPTFVQHSGASTSQIDYVISQDADLISECNIIEKTGENLSSHLAVSASITASVDVISSNTNYHTSKKAVKKYQWQNINSDKFESVLTTEVDSISASALQSAEDKIEFVNNTLNKATKAAVPAKLIKMKGPMWKASPMVLKLLSQSQLKHKQWLGSGKQDNTLKQEKILAQRELRRQIRQEHFLDRQDFYSELMTNPSTKMFYRLINRNKQSSSRSTVCIHMNGEDYYAPSEQRQCFTDYFEDLSVPKDDGFDSAYLDMINIRETLISRLCDNTRTELEPIQEQEVQTALKKLNTGKSADEFGLVAEQLKASKDILTPIITATFNQFITNKSVPNSFKGGIVTPVLKKGKNATVLDNYRGITVTPILSKLFEYTLLHRLSTSLDQSPLQFGFTEGLAPLMAAMLVSEARAEVKANTKAPLFLVTLDSRKAFDVVSHVILLDKLFESGVQPALWTLLRNMYTGLTSSVKWLGEIGPKFGINQGVRQGGILSTFLYKTYVNNVLVELKQQRLGLSIGTTYIGCPTVADDICLLSESKDELQCMLEVAVRNARQDRVTIHPTKTSAIVINKTSRYNKSDLEWTLGVNKVAPSPKATHLGIFRAESKENEINIEHRLSLARRTMYSLINTGFHGSNGLNPSVSLKIYQCYVLPRLLYGLEVLPLTLTQTSILARFHTQVYRKIQSLPERTATGIVYLLLGALPIEAELHRRQLSFLYNVLACENDTIQSLTKRQIAVNLDNHLSFYSKVSDVLELYNLPSISFLLDNPISKLKWKTQVRNAVSNYWTDKFNSEIADKSTLKYLDKSELKIGVTHPVWRSLHSTVAEVKKGITKCRILTGTYMLQATKHRFNHQEAPLCKACAMENEDIIHMLTSCPALHYVRKTEFAKLKECVISIIGPDEWQINFSDKISITKLIIDCTNFKHLFSRQSDIDRITRVSTDLCHKLHIKRTLLLQ